MNLGAFARHVLGSCLKKIVTMALLSYAVAFIGVGTAVCGQKEAEPAEPSAFVGTWTGICQDKKPFVILILHEEKGQIAGTLSIANMHGNVDAGCEEVVDPPTPEHAKEILDAKVEGSTLSFSWGKKAGSEAPKFEMKLVGKKEGELKFFGTPVENNPWKVAKE